MVVSGMVAQDVIGGLNHIVTIGTVRYKEIKKEIKGLTIF
jgi:hypothetical protein